MYPVLFPLFGPLAIHSYGFFIALGVVTFVFCVKRDARCIRLGIDKQIVSILCVSLLGALCGGKIMYHYIETQFQMKWLDMILPWNGGFSILGSIVGTFGTLFLYFSRTQNIPLNLDCIATYLPLLQSIIRIGCFFAGCCYGKTCDIVWQIQSDITAPLTLFHMHRHPTQIYSSLFLIGIFLYLLTKKNKRIIWDGQITLQYLILVSCERFIVDYWRGNRTFVLGLTMSDKQFFATILCSISLLTYMILYFYYKNKLKTRALLIDLSEKAVASMHMKNN